jgi:hypothetical protein
MKKNFLDSVEVKLPCSESWNEMIGNNEVRFCSHCAKDVHNLSEMTRAKAEKLLKKSNGKLCVRYVQTPQGKLITAPPKFTQITRRATIAAGVLATSLALSTLTYAQGEPIPPRDNSTQTKKDKKDKSKQGYSTISGEVYDAQGAIVASAKVTLLDTKTNRTRRTQTNDAGNYEFKEVEPSLYELILESPGFANLVVKEFEVSQDTKLEKNLVLGSGEVVGLLFITDNVVEPIETKISDKIELRKLEKLPINNGKFTTIGLSPGSRSKEKARQNLSTISGTIKDEQGAVIPDAKIILREVKTAKIRETRSGSNGFYEFQKVEPSIYQIEIEANGFEKLFLKNVIISKNSRIERDIVLTIAFMGEIIVIETTPKQKKKKN